MRLSFVKKPKFFVPLVLIIALTVLLITNLTPAKSIYAITSIKLSPPIKEVKSIDLSSVLIVSWVDLGHGLPSIDKIEKALIDLGAIIHNKTKDYIDATLKIQPLERLRLNANVYPPTPEIGIHLRIRRDGLVVAYILKMQESKWLATLFYYDGKNSRLITAEAIRKVLEKLNTPIDPLKDVHHYMPAYPDATYIVLIWTDSLGNYYDRCGFTGWYTISNDVVVLDAAMIVTHKSYYESGITISINDNRIGELEDWWALYDISSYTTPGTTYKVHVGGSGTAALAMIFICKSGS